MNNVTIKLELSLQEVNAIMTGLGQLPYVQVVDVVEKIKAQAIPQTQQSQEIIESDNS